MDNFHSLIVKRRSIRSFTEQLVDSEDVKMILEAGLLAPTSKSARAWQFIVVDDRETLNRLSECKPRAAESIRRAPLAIVVAVDSTKTEPWIEDASVAATYMQLQVADLGLGSCWVQVRDRYAADATPSEEYIQELLNIPETISVVCVLAIGHPAEERKAQNLEKLKWENVFIDRWEQR